jgi:oligopeptidase B
MRQRDEATLTHLSAERSWAEQTIDAFGPEVRADLVAEMRGRIREDDQSVPVREGPWLYYSRHEQDREYPIHCRRHETMDAPEHAYLNENQRAEAHEYFGLDALAISPDHRLLAYALDTTGDEIYRICFEDLETGEAFEHEIAGAGTSLAWALDSKTLYYDVLDDAHRPYRIMRHTLGTDPTSDVLVYEESDPAHYVGVYRSRDDSWIIISSGSQITTEIRALPAGDPTAEPTTVWARSHGVEASVEPAGDELFIVTNEDGAENFKLLLVPRDAVGDRGRWTELLPSRSDVYLEGVDAFARHLVLWERHEGLRRIRIVERGDLASPAGARAIEAAPAITLPDPVYAVWPGANPEYKSRKLRYGYSSPTRPSSVYSYDPLSGTSTLLKRREVVGGHDPEAYACERVWVDRGRDDDGLAVRVPMTVVYRRDADPNAAPRPTVLYGYGAYGSSMEGYFSSNRLSLLDRGVVWVVAHVRGGSELGRRWYERGKLAHKQNTFSDFIACAEALIERGATTSEKLAAWGGSAGGLLVGAVINQAPERFAVAVADVPFVDVLNTLQDASLPLTIVEWEEWGNPNKAEEYAWIRAYSPYDNVAAGPYPHLLATAGLADPRVGYWEPAKWVARIRERRTDGGSTLLWTQMEGGHAGASGRFEALHELALQYAFVLGHLLP